MVSRFVCSPPGPAVNQFGALSAGPLCVVPGYDTILLECLSPSRCINGFMRIYAGGNPVMD